VTAFYQQRILPRLIDTVMRQERLTEYRRRLLSEAQGRVLEIGVGSGLNFPFYASATTQAIGLDPSPQLLSMAERARSGARCRVELLAGSAEAIPLEDRSVDTVVTTWTLCSIPDVSRALADIRRVLRPAGRLLFVEHGRSPDANVRWWQDRLTPFWKRIAGGCHLNRPVRQLIEDSGFRIERLRTGYMNGPRLMTFMYEGRAGVK
jgi:ubiquinone/menaquinone biosynthesis C-methylase UbiE